MEIGLFIGSATDLDKTVASIRDARDAGFASAWLAQIFDLDALTVLAVAGREVDGIMLGTAVVPTYPRHPMALAGQALAVQAASGNRLLLGIGLSHQVVVEGMWGYSFDKPARHMREYLSALLPLLRGEAVSVEGETLKVVGKMTAERADAPPVLLAALAPVMLKLAGAVADGTVTWMAGPATIRDYIAPSINAAAAAAGRPAPRIAVGLPVQVTADPAGARAAAAQTFAVYGQLPSYRAMLDREGAAGPADVAIVGDADTVRAQVRALAETGATDFVASPFGSGAAVAATVDVLASLLGTV
jgi:5,10-methylenetetrahydromethanopterin reductase